MKHTLLILACALPFYLLQALDFNNLTEDAHLSGPQYSAKDLQGRVIAVEVWGYQCPPCRASLPHMAKLGKAYANDARVAIIGSHAQGRNEEAILKLLKTNGCEYAVYQFFGVSGAPSAGGLPFAYVMNHKGEVIWQGNPYSQFTAFEDAIETAVKAMPKLPTGSLLTGMDLVHCKDVIKRLTIGQNVETTLRQLQSRVKRGGAAGEEAAAIIERCEQWADEKEAAIREAMEQLPSAAVSEAQHYLRTFPARSAALKKEIAALAKDPVVSKLAASRANLAKLSQTKAATANAKKKLISQAKMQLRQLSTLAVKEDNPDYADVKALWEAFLASMTEN